MFSSYKYWIVSIVEKQIIILLCLLCVVLFVLGKPMYVMRKPEGNVLMDVMKCIVVSACKFYLLLFSSFLLFWHVKISFNHLFFYFIIINEKEEIERIEQT